MQAPLYKYRNLANLLLGDFTDDQVLKSKKYIDLGLQYYPNDLALNMIAAKFYKAKKFLACKNNRDNPYLSSQDLEDRILKEQNAAHRDSIFYYQNSCRLFKLSLSGKVTADNFSDIGDLDLLFDNIELAERSYNKALRMNKDHLPSLTGKGLVAMRNGKYQDAINFFKQVETIDPVDLNIQAKLAEAHFKMGNYADAEKIYERILAQNKNNQDALIGLGDLNKSLGDIAKEKNNGTDVEDYYEISEKYFNRALDLQNPFRPDNPPSRRLTRNEIAFINYSLGYIKCSLYETTASVISSDRQLLGIAKNYFNKIDVGTDEYSKGKTALRKIEKSLHQYALFAPKKNGWWITVIAGIILVLSLISYGHSKFKSPPAYYVSKSALKELLEKNKMDKYYPDVAAIADSQFSSTYNLKKKFDEILASKNDTIIPALDKIISPVDDGATKLEPLSEGAYITLIFGSLLFMIVGFYISEVSKLKVPGFELEKSVIEQASISSKSLGISSAGPKIGPALR